eukprot:3932780-Rhodomonas_salina.2
MGLERRAMASHSLDALGQQLTQRHPAAALAGWRGEDGAAAGGCLVRGLLLLALRGAPLPPAPSLPPSLPPSCPLPPSTARRECVSLWLSGCARLTCSLGAQTMGLETSASLDCSAYCHLFETLQGGCIPAQDTCNLEPDFAFALFPPGSALCSESLRYALFA